MRKPEKLLAQIAAWIFILFILPCVAVGALASVAFIAPFLIGALLIILVRGFVLIIKDRRKFRADFKAMVDKVRKENAAAKEVPPGPDDQDGEYKTVRRSSVVALRYDSDKIEEALEAAQTRKSALQERIAAEIKAREEGATK